MNQWKCLCFAAALTGLPLCARAQKVEAVHGNIFVTDAAGERTRLTSEGKDSAPCLDPTKKSIVFVRATPGQKVSTGSGDEEATELRLMDLDGKNPVLLVHGKDDPEPKNVLANLQTPQFSPDGKTIYFESAAYAVSGAIHALDLATKKVRFVCAGSGLEVVPRGEYAGDLLVGQHRYFMGGGSYDWYWLVTPEGKDIGAVGETTDGFKEVYVDPKYPNSKR